MTWSTFVGAVLTVLLAAPASAQLRPPSGGKAVGDYSLHDFAAKWMMQLDDVAEISHFEAANRALLAQNDPRPRTIFIGDSITENWTQLDAHQTANGRWINRGISGSNTSQMLLRFEVDAVALGPRAIVIMGGTNDLRAYEGTPASVVDGAFARVTRNLTAMADIAAGRAIKVVLCAIPLVGRDLDRIARDPAGVKRINAWIADFARQRALVFVDFGEVLTDGDGYMKAELSTDGIHPNPAGYRQMMPLIEAAVARTEAARR
jgi:lysophospholipase L1-like esterase